jgi:hypothetical protein
MLSGNEGSEEVGKSQLNIDFKNDLDITLIVGPNVPKLIICDEQRVSQVFLNLLARILTISRLSQIQVVINYDRFRDFLSIDINESGTGIIFSEIYIIQKEFKHVKENMRLTDAGEGLAFLFSKKIVEQYEGSVEMSANHDIGLSL